MMTALAPLQRTAVAQGGDAAFPGHWVVGNVYYVGSRSLASFLITTNAGHILINSGSERTVPLIRASMEELGFRLEDVRILLTSHGHSDHVGGHAAMKRLTGARILVMDSDVDVVRSGGKGDFMFEAMDGWEPVAVDGVLRDREEVRLGGVVLTARKTPGHTKGTTTWLLRTTSRGTPVDVVIIGSTSVNDGYRLVGNAGYPTIAEDYGATFAILKSLPCDVFLGAHGNYYGMEAKYKRLHSRDTHNPFIDPDGYKRYVAEREQAFLTELAKQQKGMP
jgi:metallo-beta-lactamase class B